MNSGSGESSCIMQKRRQQFRLKPRGTRNTSNSTGQRTELPMRLGSAAAAPALRSSFATAHPMTLLDYDSDSSHDGSGNIDAFQISNLAPAKKTRIRAPTSSAAEPFSAAPDVLSEVLMFPLPYTFFLPHLDNRTH